MKRVPYLFILVLLLSTIVLGACNNADEDASASESEGDIFDRVVNRGNLIAGVNSDLPGFGYVDSDGSYAGFDVEFGRAIAAAMFGDADAIEYRPLSAQERLTAVQTGEVDVLVRNTTHTLTRDVIGINFGPVIFYDGQGIMVREDSGIDSLEDLEGARIAVDTGTTTELNLADTFRVLGLDYEPIVYDGADQVVSSYEQGSADAWTTDRSGLVARLESLSNPDEHKILAETISKEPLAPAVNSSDSKWYDLVTWVVYATIQAEEYGITSENISEFMDSEDPEIRRFLGLEGELGEELGVENDFVVNIIEQVGNYGEIFERHLGSDTIFNLDRGLNDLWTEDGLLYSPPFR